MEEKKIKNGFDDPDLKFIVMSNPNLEEFTRSVNVCIKKGFKLRGNMVTFIKDRTPYFYQNLIR